MRDSKGWITLSFGRVEVRISWLIPVAAAVLVALGGDLWLRYLLLLAALLLHELGHAAVSVGLGGPRAVVSIRPYFGRAEVAGRPRALVALVALAGPVANLAAAAILLGCGGEVTLALGRAAWIDFLASINLLMGVGNLVPIPPTDGWRIVRALSWRA